MSNLKIVNRHLHTSSTASSTADRSELRHRDHKRITSRKLFLLSGVLSLGLSSELHAATFNWTNTGDGLWTTTTNWSSNLIPVSNNANIVTFGGSTNYISTLNSATNPFILNSLQFNNSSVDGVTLASTGGAITLRGTAPSIFQNGPAPVSITAPLEINVNNATIEGTGTGALSITKLSHTAAGNHTVTFSTPANVSIGTFAVPGLTNKTINNNIVGTNTLTIGNIELGSPSVDYTLSLGGSGTTVVNGVISGGGSAFTNLTKADAGTLILNGTANTFQGTLQVNNGTLQVASLADLGTGSNGVGAIKILNSNQANATLRYVGSGTTITRPIDIFANGPGLGSATIESSGTGALTLGAVSRSQSAAATTKAFVLSGTNTDANTVAGVISDGAGPLNVVKTGVGNWTLSGANTYTGSTTVSAGILTQGNAAAFGTSSKFTVINGGKLDATVAGIALGSGGVLTAGRATDFGPDIIGNVSLTNSTLEVSPSTNFAGTFTLHGDLSLADTALKFSLSSPAVAGGGINDLIDVGGTGFGNLNLAGTINVEVSALNGPLVPGNYPLFQYSGSLTGSAANFAQPTGLAAGRSSYSYDTSAPGVVSLVVTGNSANLTWIGNGSTNAWDKTTQGLFIGASPDQFFDNDIVNFNDDGAANSTVTIAEAVQPFAVNVAGTGNYAFVGNGSIAAAATLSKSGTGTLSIQTANTYSGTSMISEGAVSLANAAGLGTVAGNTTIQPGAQLLLQDIGDVAEPFALNGTGITQTGAVRNVAGAKTLTGVIVLQSDVSITNSDSANQLKLAGPISGTPVLSLHGPGTIAIEGTTANTNTGVTSIFGGTVILNKSTAINALGGNVTIGDGVEPATLRLAVANQLPNTAVISIAANSTFDLAGNSERIGALTGAGFVTLGTGAVLELNGTTTDTFSGVISGDGGFSRLNGGTTILTGTNTYTGQTIIQNGESAIVIGIDNALPVTTTVNFLGTTNPNVVLDLNGKNQTIGALIGATSANGSAYVQNNSGSGVSTLTITNGSGQFPSGTGNAIIRDNGGVAGGKVALTITGGTTTLRRANTYTGPTTIIGGTLAIGVSQGVSQNSVVTIDAGGALDLNGFNQTLLSLNGTGLVSGPTPANLTISNGDFAGVIGGLLNLVKQNASTFTVSGTSNTFTGNLEARNGTLVVHSLADSGTGSNGTGPIKILNSTNLAATLKYVGSGHITTRDLEIVGIDSTPGSAILDSSGTGALSIGGVTQSGTNLPKKTVSLQGSSELSNTVAGVISDGTGILSLEKAGAGNWLLANANTYTGNTTVTAGTLQITGSHTTGANYSVATGANLITNNIRVTNALTVNGTTTINANGGLDGASKVESLTIGEGGKLNLKDNDLVVGTAANLDAVRAAIIAGKTSNAATGITSDLIGFGISRGFGYALGSDPSLSPLLAGSLSGQTYDSDSVLVKYTLLGDADLDGDTDLNDLGLWSSTYTGDLGVTTSPTTFWIDGDFDYDGDTDLNDLGLWSSTYTGDLNGGPGSLVVPVAPGTSAQAISILNRMGFAVTIVPEPSTFILAGVGLMALSLTAQQKRRSKKAMLFQDV